MMKARFFKVIHEPRSLMLIGCTLTGISFIVLRLSWIVCISLVPIFLYLKKSGNRERKTIIKDFYIGGFILSGFANLFLFQMSPENWNIGITGWVTVVARLIAWFLVCSFGALAYAGIGFLIACFKSVQSRILILPFFFPLAELLRSYLFAFMAYGPQGSFSPNFQWGSLAVPGSGTPLIYSTRILGFFGLTFLIIVINLSVYLLTQRRIYPATMLALAVCLTTVVGWKIGSSNGLERSIHVSVLHLSAEDEITIDEREALNPQNTDILVLPEYSAIEKNLNKPMLLNNLKKNGVAITSIVYGKSPQGTNRIIYLNKNGDVLTKQDKTFLIPTGEVLPYSLQLSFKTIGKGWVNDAFKYTQQLKKGDRPEEVFVTKDNIALGTLACSGVSALNEYSRLTSEGASILVNSASLSFLTENSLYHVYAHNMARFQAVSNNRPLAQASRSGESYILDNQGRVLVESSGQNRQVLSASVRLPH
jgi:apolipoprotein N-acyltransferase